MRKFFYNLLLPVGFLFFLPGLLYKFRHRGGWKDTFAERFGRFSPERAAELARWRGAVWIHAVSVGETVIAVNLIRVWQNAHPERRFVLSTTTTTGQELARSRKLDNTEVIFCPIDFPGMVRRTLDLIAPVMLVILETEIWPNLIWECRKRSIPVALANGRMSDHSARGYRRGRIFFGPLLAEIPLLLVQSEADRKRYLSVSPVCNVVVSGNLKFDQQPPENIADPELAKYFGPGEHLVLLGASTHSGEEEFLVENFLALKPDFPSLRLVLVPRHAERGRDIAEMIERHQVSYYRRSLGGAPNKPVEVLLADTTGEMFKFLKYSDIVIMGKSLAGHDEGHNLIEPALLDKPIVTGHILRNFRFILNALLAEDAVAVVSCDAELKTQLTKLLGDPELRRELGARAGAVVRRHCGATGRTVEALEKLLESASA